MTEFYSAPLGQRERGAFVSGNARLDDFFHKVVSQDVRRNYATCNVLVESASETIAGFYTLSTTQISLPDIPAALARKLPRYPVAPAVLIGWMARDIRFRGRDIGNLLLLDVMERVAKSPFGVWCLCADAIDKAAVDFYRRHHFVALEKQPMRLILPMTTIREILASK